MSNNLKTALRFAAVASIATTISATSALAGDKLPSAEIMAITYEIQAEQAVRRAEPMDMIETARSLNVSPRTVALMEQGNLDIAVSSGPSDD